MNHRITKPLFAGIIVAGLAAAAYADKAKDEGIAKDRQRIEGTWRIVELVVNGNPANEEDARKLTVVNGADGTWSLRSEGAEVAKGTSTFDPTQEPKTIDFTVAEEGNQHLGIYVLGDKTRKLCFAPPGKERPTEFTSSSDSEHILVKFERVTSP